MNPDQVIEAMSSLESARNILKRIERSLRQERCCELHLDGTADILQDVSVRLELVINLIDDAENLAPSSRLQPPVNLS